MPTKKPKIKAKVTAIIAVFDTDTQVQEFFNYQLSFHKDLVFVSSNFKEINGKFYATIIFASEYDANYYVLHNKSAQEVYQIAKYSNIKLSQNKVVTVPLTKEDVLKKIESGEIDKNEHYFVYANIDNLFAKTAYAYRKTVFEHRNLEFFKQVRKVAKAAKSEIIDNLLMYISDFDYSAYAWEIALLLDP